MSFLVDTCLISELVKPRPDPNVLSWIETVDEGRLYLSVLTLGELAKGIAKLPDSPRKDKLLQWVEQDLKDRFAGRILPIEADVAMVWGSLQGGAERAGEKLPVIDALLTATAAIHQLTIATRNVADFTRCGATVFNPWNA